MSGARAFRPTVAADGRLVTLSEAQASALVRLSRRGGEGAITVSGYLLAAGETLNAAPETWLRLITFGLVAPAGPHRLQLTPGGRTVAAACNRTGGVMDAAATGDAATGDA